MHSTNCPLAVKKRWTSFSFVVDLDDGWNCLLSSTFRLSRLLGRSGTRHFEARSSPVCIDPVGFLARLAPKRWDWSNGSGALLLAEFAHPLHEAIPLPRCMLTCKRMAYAVVKNLFLVASSRAESRIFVPQPRRGRCVLFFPVHRRLLLECRSTHDHHHRRQGECSLFTRTPTCVSLRFSHVCVACVETRRRCPGVVLRRPSVQRQACAIPRRGHPSIVRSFLRGRSFSRDLLSGDPGGLWTVGPRMGYFSPSKVSMPLGDSIEIFLEETIGRSFPQVDGGHDSPYPFFDHFLNRTGIRTAWLLLGFVALGGSGSRRCRRVVESGGTDVQDNDRWNPTPMSSSQNLRT